MLKSSASTEAGRLLNTSCASELLILAKLERSFGFAWSSASNSRSQLRHAGGWCELVLFTLEETGCGKPNLTEYFGEYGSVGQWN